MVLILMISLLQIAWLRLNEGKTENTPMKGIVILKKNRKMKLGGGETKEGMIESMIQFVKQRQ